MRFWDKVGMAWQQVRAGGMRSGLCMSAVGIGVCAMVIIGGIGQYTAQVAEQAVHSLGLQGMTTYLDESDSGEQLLPAFAQTMVEQIDEITTAMAVQFVSGSYQVGYASGSAMLVGVDGNVGTLLELTVVEGRLFWGQDTTQMGQVALISQSLAEQAFGRTNVVGREIRIDTGAQSGYYTILGVVQDQKEIFGSTLSSAMPEIIYLPYAQLASVGGSVDQIVFAGTLDTAELTQKINQLATQERYQGTMEVQNLSGYMQQLNALIADVTKVFLCVAGISLLVALSAVASGLLSATREMRQQIGICRAIGAKKSDIFAVFLLHAQFLCLLGAGLGTAVAGICFALLGAVSGVQLQFDWQTVGICVALSMLCGMTAGAYPAHSAASLDPKIAMSR